jgi:GNAT superfamily N-acetyltransferase
MNLVAPPAASVAASPSSSPETLRTVAWLDGVLGRSGETSVALDLPLLFRDEPRTIRRTHYDAAGDPVAHAAARLQRCVPRRRPGGPPPRDVVVAFVGAVAVDPRVRRRGLGRRALNDVVSAAALRGAELAVLWSENDPFYVAAGFSPAGTETVFAARRRAFRVETRRRVRPYRPGDFEALVRLHDLAPARVVRDRATWRTLLAVPRTSTYVLEREGEAVAYGVVGRGADLAGTLHEWGGSEADLPALVGGVLARRREQEIYVLAPRFAEQARTLFALRGAEIATGPLCMAKPLLPGVGLDVVDDLWFTGFDSM